MSRYGKKYKAYKLLPLISLVVLAICFIFRYSYINILGYDRPLKLAVLICTTFGVIGTFMTLIEGVNKNFAGDTLLFLIINILFIATFPILTIAEQAVKPVVNPFDELIPETEYTTKNREDAAFLLEGELYEWPLEFNDFLDKGYQYRELEDNKYSLSKMGDSNYDVKPTWFTDGSRTNQIATESYQLELILDGKGPIESQNVEDFKIRSRQDNWDFEIQGYTLLESVHSLEAAYGDRLVPDPDNKNLTIKLYYLETTDGYEITFGALQGKVQYVEIKRAK